ncbi:unnamed protein product [Laminaria digitata]
MMRCGDRMYRSTVVAAAIACSIRVTAASQQPSVPTAFAWGSNTFTAGRRSLALPGTSRTRQQPQQQLSPVNTAADKRYNSTHSSSSSSSSSGGGSSSSGGGSSILRMTSHDNGKYNIRTCCGGEDYDRVIDSVDGWWGGRRMTPMLPRLFFEQFYETTFMAEMAQGEEVDEPAAIVGFVCGFIHLGRPEVSAPPRHPTVNIHTPTHRTDHRFLNIDT